MSDPLRTRIWRQLHGTPKSAQTLARRMGLDCAQVSDLVRSLHRIDAVERVERGLYVATQRDPNRTKGGRAAVPRVRRYG